MLQVGKGGEEVTDNIIFSYPASIKQFKTNHILVLVQKTNIFAEVCGILRQLIENM